MCLNASPWVADGGVAVNILSGSCGQPTGNGPPAWGLGEKLTTRNRKRTGLLRNITQGLGIGGPCENGNEPSGSIKGREFLD